MARTKKYLARSTAIRSSRSFYRPIKRLKNLHDQDQSEVSVSDLKSPLLSSELLKLEEQIQKAQALKAELEHKLATEKDPKTEPKEDLHVSLGEIKLAASDNKQVTPEDPEPRGHESGENEMYSLFEKGIQQSLKHDDRIKKELEQIKQTFEEEKKKMSETIKDLKREVKQVEPIHQNKFFSISKELQDVVEAMNKLITENDTPQVAQAIQPVQLPPQLQPAQVPTNQPVSQNPQVPEQKQSPAATSPETASATAAAPAQPITTAPLSPTPTATTTPSQPTPETPTNPEIKPPKKSLFAKIPKPVKVLTSTLLLVAAIAGGLWFTLNRQSEVNTALVQEYLPEGTSLQDDAEEAKKKITEASGSAEGSQTPKPETKGASDSRYAESQANVPYDQTVWETYKDPIFGVELNYPKNAVNVIRTDSSITFIRKTGYIFKIQLIETALDEKEYWKLVKASSLNYKVKEDTFQNFPALFLELEDFSDYPGDKYLVKKEDYIYDIWYATYSPTLSEDDAKRIELMLKSFKFI